MQSLASYFSEAFGAARPIYAVLCIASTMQHSPGDLLTWSVSKRAARAKIAAQWEPGCFHLLRISRV